MKKILVVLSIIMIISSILIGSFLIGENAYNKIREKEELKLL